MEAFISSVSDVGVIAILCAIFVIMLMCVQKVVEEMGFFGGAAGWVVAFCVALLSIAGLSRFLGSPGLAAHSAGELRETGGWLDLFLLPYVALALTVLLVLLIPGIVNGRQHARKPRRRSEGTRDPTTCTHPSLHDVGEPLRERRACELAGRVQIAPKSVPRQQYVGPLGLEPRTTAGKKIRGNTYKKMKKAGEKEERRCLKNTSRLSS